MPQIVHHPHVEVICEKAFIRGTRVTVRRLWSWHRKGVTVDSLVRRYPTLGWAKVLDALSWGYDNMEQVEKELAEEHEDDRGSLDMEQLKLRLRGRL